MPFFFNNTQTNFCNMIESGKNLKKGGKDQLHDGLKHMITFLLI